MQHRMNEIKGGELGRRLHRDLTKGLFHRHRHHHRHQSHASPKTCPSKAYFTCESSYQSKNTKLYKFTAQMSTYWKM